MYGKYIVLCVELMCDNFKCSAPTACMTIFTTLPGQSVVSDILNCWRGGGLVLENLMYYAYSNKISTCSGPCLLLKMGGISF
jgi:hypothetical protein